MPKLSNPTRNIASRLIFALIHNSFLDGFVASFSIRLPLLMKLPIPIMVSLP